MYHLDQVVSYRTQIGRNHWLGNMNLNDRDPAASQGKGLTSLVKIVCPELESMKRGSILFSVMLLWRMFVTSLKIPGSCVGCDAIVSASCIIAHSPAEEETVISYK